MKKEVIWRKLRIGAIVIGIIWVSNKVLLFWLPTILGSLTLSEQMKTRIAQYLLITTILVGYYLQDTLFGKKSESRCPFCGSFKFFVKKSETTGQNIEKGKVYIKRAYKCKACDEEEILYVKPISLNLAHDERHD